MRCPVCTAILIDGMYQVSVGKPLSPEKQCARVCTYIKSDVEKNKQCLNKTTIITPEEQIQLGYRPI